LEILDIPELPTSGKNAMKCTGFAGLDAGIQESAKMASSSVAEDGNEQHRGGLLEAAEFQLF
jgi:hypothetical protein